MPNVDISFLIELQTALDKKINEQRETPVNTIFDSKVLGLQVELGELANAWNMFKYWKAKPQTNRSLVLEEYIDCLHFLFSLSAERLKEQPSLLNFYISYPEKGTPQNTAHIVKRFNELFELNGYLIDHYSFNYQQAFQKYFELGHALGFSWDDIVSMYIYKNQLNHERLNNNY